MSRDRQHPTILLIDVPVTEQESIDVIVYRGLQTPEIFRYTGATPAYAMEMAVGICRREPVRHVIIDSPIQVWKRLADTFRDCGIRVAPR